MTNISAETRNYFKLQCLIPRSNLMLRRLFKSRYSLFHGGQIWDDSQTCGTNYLTNVIAKNKKTCLTSVQKTSVSNGNSDEWDLTTLTALLLYGDRPTTLNKTQIQQIDEEDKLLKQLRDIRNMLAHHATKSITDVEFNRLWSDLSTILVAFGDVNTEVDKLKDDTIFESRTQSIDEENVKEALRLNSLGTQAHKSQKFSDAITLFTKATVLSGVSDHDRAVFYSNMSASRLALYELKSDSFNIFEIEDPKDQRYRALQDAKQARNLWSIWWRGHFRIGKVYAVLNEHEKAIISFEQALALEPTNIEIQKALDGSRQIYGRQSRQEHFDPRLEPRTMFEQLKQLQEKMGVNPEHVRQGHDMVGDFDPSGADVVKGHKYEHGDIDVKQDYEQAAKYFAKAASQGNAEGMYNLARLTDLGLGVKKDLNAGLKLLEQAAAQPPQHPFFKVVPNLGVAEAEHALGLRYAEGISVHKNLPTAAYWYERAVDHGSAQSANTLALMYLYGNGVGKDLVKAEQLLELSSRRGDPNAMLTLAELLRDKNDFKMAKMWYDRACEAGNIVAKLHREMFEKSLNMKKQFANPPSPNITKVLNVMKNAFDSLKPKGTVYKMVGQRFIYVNNYDVLNEHANRGSITAKKMCDALEHFMEALNIFMEFETLTEKQEDMFVHELSKCYRIEHIVAQFPSVTIKEKTDTIIDRVLRRCSLESNVTNSNLDEDARICYAILHMDSHAMVAQFLESCKQKYPKSIHFFELSANVHGWLDQYEAALYDANTGLQIDPNYYKLLYTKAVALRLLGHDMNEAVTAYDAFISVAPKDHRKVPESYYAMSSCYLMRDSPSGMTDIVEKTYRKGEEAEKIQLPWFLPYESNSKILLKTMFDAKSLVNKQSSPSINPVDPRLRLTNPHRIDVIKRHRKWEATVLEEKNKPEYCLVSSTYKSRVTQQTAKSLIGLKQISLKEMNPTKDHVYDGCILFVTIIEEAYSWAPSIHLVIEDEHLDCERMCIYNFPEEQGEYLTNKVYTIGS